MSELDTVLVDTSTLLNLLFPYPEADGSGRVLGPLTGVHGDRIWNDYGCGAVEALVLFDRVVLDGPSVEVNQAQLGWLNDIWDGISIKQMNRAETSRLYLRAASLFQGLDWSSPTLRNYLHHHGLTHNATSELADDERFFRSTIRWGEVLQYFSDSQSEEVVKAFTPPRRVKGEIAGNGALQLARHFYYVALQEQTGGALLLHPAKSLWRANEAPSYGYSSRIIDVFDRKVRREYSARRKRWLGEDLGNLSFPLLTAFVIAESFRRSWSIGRTIAWLREQPEVHLFRRGMRGLMEHVAAGDEVAVSAVLHELETASDRLAQHLGAPTRKYGRISLQVPLPFLQPAVGIPVPRPARSPAERMLVLIKWMLRGG